MLALSKTRRRQTTDHSIKIRITVSDPNGYVLDSFDVLKNEYSLFEQAVSDADIAHVSNAVRDHIEKRFEVVDAN